MKFLDINDYFSERLKKGSYEIIPEKEKKSVFDEIFDRYALKKILLTDVDCEDDYIAKLELTTKLTIIDKYIADNEKNSLIIMMNLLVSYIEDLQDSKIDFIYDKNDEFKVIKNGNTIESIIYGNAYPLNIVISLLKLYHETPLRVKKMVKKESDIIF